VLERAADGRVSGIEIAHNGPPERCEQLSGAAPPLDMMAQRLAGSFRCEDLDAQAVARLEDGALQLSLRGRYGRAQYRLDPLRADCWRFRRSPPGCR